MRRAKTMTGIAMAIALMAAVALLGVPSHAVAEEYGYTVRVFSGNKGSVNGEEVASFKVSKGEEIDLTEAVSVGIGDSAYYHKGFREAGQDDEFPYRAFPVERDIDLVVSYGMRAQMAKVTLHFREYGTGRPLVADDGSDSVACECKVGDKPVIAFRHIEGYRPLYRNVTGTVTGDTVRVARTHDDGDRAAVDFDSGCRDIGLLAGIDAVVAGRDADFSVIDLNVGAFDAFRACQIDRAAVDLGNGCCMDSVVPCLNSELSACDIDISDSGIFIIFRMQAVLV